MSEIIHAKFRGVVGAMAMTGMRVFALHAGLIREDPPSRLTRKQARGLVERVPRKRRRVVVELVHWAMGGVFGIVFGLLPERHPAQALVGPGVRRPRLAGVRRGGGARARADRAQLAEGARASGVRADHCCSGSSSTSCGRARANDRVDPARRGIRVEGVVQGVGFRPYVHRLAGELGLDGFVRNDEHGVVIEVEGPAEAIEALLARLPAEAPPLAAVEGVEPGGRAGARASPASRSPAAPARRGAPDALVSPDTATCADCLRELFDPADRRHRYPFINCTNCGPRFTIVRGVPYDRPLTTMAGFTMCAPCAAEYHDPADRRFHAQPNACPDCGPR